MTNTSTYTYILGAMQILFGVLGLVFGWVSVDVAVALISTGAGIFGITFQNVKLGKSLGHAV